MSMSVYLRLSVREDISETNFCACCLCPWLGPPPAR